jgi:hypothetical protein
MNPWTRTIGYRVGDPLGSGPIGGASVSASSPEVAVAESELHAGNAAAAITAATKIDSLITPRASADVGPRRAIARLSQRRHSDGESVRAAPGSASIPAGRPILAHFASSPARYAPHPWIKAGFRDGASHAPHARLVGSAIGTAR